MRVVSDVADVEFAEVNARIFFAAIVIVPWFALRARVFGTPSSLSVLLEWLVLIVLTMLLAKLPLRTPAKLRLVPIAGAGVFIVLSILDVGEFPAYPSYWMGFGLRVAWLSGFLTLLVLLGGIAIRG